MSAVRQSTGLPASAARSADGAAEERRLWGHRLLLVVLCLALYLPGLAAIPPLDRDESRFAQATKQMLETGDFIDIRFQDQPRHKKPAATYWLQAAAAYLAGSPPYAEIFPYRLPSLLGALAAVLLTHAVALRMFGRRAALLAGAFLGASVLLTSEAHQAKSDALLLAAVCTTQLALAQVYLAAKAGEAAPTAAAWLFWGALGVAVLVKGPVGPAVAGLTIAALVIADRQWAWLRELHPWAGLVLCAGVVLPWLLAITWVSDGAFLRHAFQDDLLPKLLGGHEGHGAPPGAQALLLLATFSPGSLFLLPALSAAWRQRRMPAVRFLLAWVLPAWIVFEAVPTKLPHYPLPLLPALAVMVGALLADWTHQPSAAATRSVRWSRWIGSIWGAGALLVGIALILLPVYLGSGAEGTAILGAALLTLAAGLTVRWMWRSHLLAAAKASLLCALLAYPTLFGATLPVLDSLWTSRRVAAAIERTASAPAKDVVAVGYGEPSLVFLLGTGTRLLSAAEAAPVLADGEHHLLIVEQRQERAVFRAAEQRSLALALIAQVEGFNYSKGQRVTIRIYEVGGQP